MAGNSDNAANTCFRDVHSLFLDRPHAPYCYVLPADAHCAGPHRKGLSQRVDDVQHSLLRNRFHCDKRNSQHTHYSHRLDIC